mmetsp:Transcript_3221/g.4383  ORF Transcript_3221/g.4383 Transcript_3221/m.4383 type:complete len:279 (+) Transcript_3221:119-955(+)
MGIFEDFQKGPAALTACIGVFTFIILYVCCSVKKQKKHPWVSDHIRVDDGGLRAAVFGFSDGCVSNVCLILGVFFSMSEESEAIQSKSVVISGLAGLLGGACSMACGEWVSMVAQKQGLESEIKVERRHLRVYEKEERKLLKSELERNGLSPETADAVIKDISKQGEEKMLLFHTKMVLGIDSEELGSPFKSAAFSFFCFAIGALTPLIPWIFIEDQMQAFQWTLVMVSFATVAAGSLQAQYSHRGVIWVSCRQLLVMCISAILSVGSSYLTSGSVVS